ncbi:MAG TPA: hypothetical protein VFZ42_13625 [Chitinophagaceae bacterium]
MKKTMLLGVACLIVTMQCIAQDEEVEVKKGFKKENLFTGGSITLSFFNNQTVLGANPIFGYKLADWVDAGLAFNYLYSSARDYAQYNDKIRQSVFGPGVFTRLYPIKFLFAQAQYEYNFSQLKYIYPSGSPIEKQNVDAPSLLIGGGLAQGRQKGSTTFYYISVLFDVLKNVNSPYVSVSFNPSNPTQQRVDILPIIRAGINVGLFQGKYNEGY